MKKIIFFLSLYMFFSLSTVYGGWYGNTPVGYTNGTATWCPWDGDTTGGTPAGYSNDRAVTNSSVSLTPTPIYNTYGINSNQTNAIGVGTSGTMYCLKWDGASPSGSISFANGWTGIPSQSVSWSSSDAGGSGVGAIQLQYATASTTGPSTTTAWSGWAVGATLGTSLPFTGVNHTAYKTQLVVTDRAGNTTTIGNANILKIDTTIPTITLSDYNSAWRGPFNLTLSVSDGAGSGIAVSRYAWNSVPDCNVGTGTPFVNGTSILVGPPYGANTLYLCSKDAVGNIRTLSQVYRIDNVPPVITASPTTLDWTNSNISVNLSCSDPSYTNCTKLQYAWSTSTTTPGSYTNTITGTNPTTTATITTDGVWYLHVRAEDAAVPTPFTTYFGPYKLDKTVPTATDILSTTPANTTNLLATTSQNFVPSVSVNGGSPITSVKVFFEDYATVNSLKATSNECVSGCAQDIRNVYNDTNVNGGRIYSLQFARVCDQAGNCLGNDISTSNLKTFTYNVYANTTAMVGGFASTKITANPFSGVQIADGGGDTLVITLKDIFGNEIISSSGINRKVDFKFVTDNTLYLNQYDKSGNAIYTSTPADPSFLNRFNTGNNVTTNITAQTSNNGIYSFTFKGYSPTYNVYNKAVPNSAFTIKDLKFSTTGTLGVVSNIDVQNTSGTNVSANNIDFQYTPLYETVISGEQRIDGFIEGSIQSGTLSLNKNFASSVSTSNIKVYLEHGTGARLPISNLNMYIGTLTSPTTLALKGQQTSLSTGNYLDNTSAGVRNLYTKLIQTSSVGSLQNTYLSSHISYAITAPNGVGTINPIYNSDIIGKSNYWNDTSDSNSTQKGVKIVGIASSGSGSEIVVNQFTNDVKIFGDLYKASLKRDIVEGAYSFVKGVTSNNGLLQIKDLQDFSNSALTTGNGGVKIDNNTVLYFGSGSNYRVDLGNGDEMVTGKKTIVIIGGNLYIKNNMYYQNKNTDMLGIIVLKDSNGYGGNIYINPDVTNVVGTIFAEKSVLSYNGVELDGDTSQSILKNQLHIYGSVFSENTIGGSRLTAPACPYYITSLCDIKLAQKYDLNYLRRYFISPYSGLPANSGKVIGGGTCTLASCTGGSPSFMKNITSISDTYITYPVVIEYNPMLSTNPPPLFTK